MPPAATTRWHGITNGQRVVAHRAAGGARRARPAGEARELAVGNDLAPPHFARERLEHDAAEAVDLVEVELQVERVALAREPVVELAGDLAVGRAGLGVGLVVTGQADLAHARVGDARPSVRRTGWAGARASRQLTPA